MTDPFRIDGPACISFSGGRTSGYMLRQILDAHGGGALPDDVHVLFANTGKERLETLDFVHECATRWGVRVRWIEYTNFVPFVTLAGVDQDGRAIFEPGDLCHAFREVSYDTASRRGEPFEALIEAWRHLPNPTQRTCTQGLKIRPMNAFARSVGFDHWTSVIGLRADEPRRVAKATAPTRERWEIETPLARAGATLRDVSAFWAAQPFDLRLRSHEGNCDLCFLKGRDKLMRIMRARPDLVPWWIAQEGRGYGDPGDALFRHDRPSYAQMLNMVQRTPLLPGLGLEEDDDAALPCACTD